MRRPKDPDQSPSFRLYLELSVIRDGTVSLQSFSRPVTSFSLLKNSKPKRNERKQNENENKTKTGKKEQEQDQRDGSKLDGSMHRAEFADWLLFLFLSLLT